MPARGVLLTPKDTIKVNGSIPAKKLRSRIFICLPYPGPFLHAFPNPDQSLYRKFLRIKIITCKGLLPLHVFAYLQSKNKNVRSDFLFFISLFIFVGSVVLCEFARRGIYIFEGSAFLDVFISLYTYPILKNGEHKVER